MNEPLGDTITWIMVGIWCFTFAAGWLVLIVFSLLKWILPNYEYGLERVLQMIFQPLGFVQKYGIYLCIILIVFRLIAYALGWAPPMF